MDSQADEVLLQLSSVNSKKFSATFAGGCSRDFDTRKLLNEPKVIQIPSGTHVAEILRNHVDMQAASCNNLVYISQSTAFGFKRRKARTIARMLCENR